MVAKAAGCPGESSGFFLPSALGPAFGLREVGFPLGGCGLLSSLPGGSLPLATRFRHRGGKRPDEKEAHLAQTDPLSREQKAKLKADV